MDVLVIGCGLSGAVVARHLAEAGKKVVIWERRDHIGGNMYDYMDEHGILIHKYGPHTFHTTKKELFDYMARFCEWDEYRLCCGTEIDGICTPTPFNFKTIDDFYPPVEAKELKQRIVEAFPGRKTATVMEVLACPDPMVRGYAEFLFAKDYSLYTAKQWRVSPSEIDPSILRRVPLRFSYDEGYFDDEFQMMPKVSFTEFFQNLLNHPNISVELSVEALKHLQVNDEGTELLLDGKSVNFPVVYTGALDELFGLSEGPLPYRSLRFEWKFEEKDSFQPYPVVAYPQANGFTRIVEFKKLPVQDVPGTTYEVEYPISYLPGQGAEPYYPLLTEASQLQYSRYAEKVARVKHLYCCGRLADFKYYNMDQALEKALQVSSFLEQVYLRNNEVE